MLTAVVWETDSNRIKQSDPCLRGEVFCNNDGEPMYSLDACSTRLTLYHLGHGVDNGLVGDVGADQGSHNETAHAHFIKPINPCSVISSDT